MSRAPSETVQLKVRMKEPLRARIEEAAQERGVSMNAEAVTRLEQSFAADDREDNEFGGREKYQVFRMLSAAAETIESRMGGSWLADEDTATTVNFTWGALAEQLLPILSPEKMGEKIVSADPRPSIPDLPDKPVHPLQGTLASRLANITGEDIAREVEELAEANATHDAAIADYREKLVEQKVALDEERAILDRHQQRINKWIERVSSSVSEGVQAALSLFPPRR